MDLNRYYTKWSIFHGAFFGGPIVGGYLLSRNFKVLGNESRSSSALWGGVMLALFGMILFLLLPDEWVTTTLTVAIAGFWAGLSMTVYLQFQKDELDTDARDNLRPASAWRVAGITLAGMFVYICMIGVFSVPTMLSSLSLPGSNSGAEASLVEHEANRIEQIAGSLSGSTIRTEDTARSVYFEPPVTEEHASTTGMYLEAIGVFSNGPGSIPAVKLETDAEGFRLLLPVSSTARGTKPFLGIVESIIVDLSRWLDAPVQVSTVSIDPEGNRSEITYRESDFSASPA
ncbi:hypothetical protein CRI94_14245 [Longibacter salinarum]|uniref:Uncharacterized protein n=1 Tax=Longibacter salinarum TaxID=1850348 RepID=A0A2A8CVN4_9BACT|nr:hypothetical protein [Longibacter salinarum]PEN12670.1 hypothetical protein CRI94_14245 [Longibacter salinarum]